MNAERWRYCPPSSGGGHMTTGSYGSCPHGTALQVISSLVVGNSCSWTPPPNVHPLNAPDTAPQERCCALPLGTGSSLALPASQPERLPASTCCRHICCLKGHTPRSAFLPDLFYSITRILFRSAVWAALDSATSCIWTLPDLLGTVYKPKHLQDPQPSLPSLGPEGRAPFQGCE